MVKKSSKKITILFLALLVFTTITNISLARNNHTDIPFKFKFGVLDSRKSTNVSAAKTDNSSVYVKNTGNARFYVSEIWGRPTIGGIMTSCKDFSRKPHLNTGEYKYIYNKVYEKGKRYCDIEIEKGPSGWKGTVEGVWSPDSI